jgi:exosortase A
VHDLVKSFADQPSAVVRTSAEETPTLQWPRPALVAVSSLIIILALFRQTSLSIVERWYSSRTFSHGFLVVPLFLYLVWIERERIAWLSSRPNFWGLPLLAALSGVWLLGNVGEIQVLQQFALVGMLDAAVWTILGNDVVRVLRFPLAFLFFAVPFGEGIIGPLQDFTAWFAVTALRLSSISVMLENRTIYLASGVWSVAEACSGIRYLLTSVMLGLIFSSLVYRSWKRRLAFTIASIAVPIVANGLRAYGIILLGYLSNNRLAVGVDHIVYGWLFLTVIQLALFAVGLKWRESPSDGDRNVSAHPADVAALPNELVPSTKAALIAAIAAVTLVAVAPLVSAHLWNRVTAFAGWSEPIVDVSLPWHSTATHDAGWAPYLQGADKEFSQSYKAGERRVDLYLALYSDRHGVELVGNYNLLANPRLWSDANDGFEDAIIDGQTIKVHRSLLESNAASRLVWTWYWVGGEYTANPRRVKFLQAKARLLGRSATSAVIALGGDFPAEPSDGERILQDFLSHTSLSAAFHSHLR